MKKADLVSSLSQKHKLPRSKAQEIIEDLFEELSLAMERGDKIDLRGFGTFSVRRTKARIGRVIATGERVDIPARSLPDFRPGKELVARCNSAASSAQSAAVSATLTTSISDGDSPRNPATSQSARRDEQDRQTL